MVNNISIHHAPVLTLWATIVAQRLGFNKNESLTLGKAIAGPDAQAKEQRLGIFRPHEQKAKDAREQKQGEEFWIEVCGRSVPARNTDEGVRAVAGNKPIDPSSAQQYLESKFGEELDAVWAALEQLAKAYRPKELTVEAYPLYEKFCPAIPDGENDGGAVGDLDLGLIVELANR